MKRRDFLALAAAAQNGTAQNGIAAADDPALVGALRATLNDAALDPAFREVVQQSRVVRSMSFAVTVMNNGGGAIVQRAPPPCEARLTPHSYRLPTSRQVPRQN